MQPWKKKDLTMTEAFFTQKIGYDVSSGERIEFIPDQIYINEMLAAVVIPKMNEIGASSINAAIPKDSIKCFMDHGGIGATPAYNELHQIIRTFCKQNLLEYYEPGTGIGHIVMAELGFISPGDIIVGTDSHTTTHGGLHTFSLGIGGSDLLEILVTGKTWLTIPSSIKFTLSGNLKGFASAKDVSLAILRDKDLSYAVGKSIEFMCEENLPIASRQTMANMAAELGAVTGIFPFDTELTAFVERTTLQRNPRPVRAGEDAIYEKEGSLELGTVKPLVAKPHQPNNVVPASELSDIIPDQIYIGSCTNSRIEDLRVVGSILKGKKVKIQTLISPGSLNVQKQAENEGVLKTFLDSGCNIIYPGCNACFGGPVGLLGKGMIGLSTTNRNFSGRMGGDQTTKVYLASPATATASAVGGKITCPEDM